MELYNEPQARYLLRALAMKPYLLHDGVHTFDEKGGDFSPSDFHERLFQIIYRLSGQETISTADIISFAEAKSKVVLDLLKRNNFVEFFDSYESLVDLSNFDSYYNAVRKMSLLRKYRSQGFDTTQYEMMSYDDMASLSIKDITDSYEGRMALIKNEFYKNDEIDEQLMDERLTMVKDEFKKTPMWGADFIRDFDHLNTNSLTQALRGWQYGQLTCISCGSGMGKSCFGLAQLANVCCCRMWSISQGKWIDNPFFVSTGGLVIQYEMNAMTEIAPRLMATVSGVPCYHILNGKYDAGEEERVDEAIHILTESRISIITMPNFTVDTVESYVKQYVLGPDKVKFVVFDYLSEQASASMDLVKKSGTQQRTDQILAQIASKLKDIAVIHEVAILTFTQVNANINTAEILDAGVIASSRAVQNKLDCGVVMHSLRAKEQEYINTCIETGAYRCSEFMKPNRVLHVYKARFGSCEPNIRIFINLDLSTGRVTEFFDVDKEGNPVPLVLDKNNTLYKINEHCPLVERKARNT